MHAYRRNNVITSWRVDAFAPLRHGMLAGMPIFSLVHTRVAWPKTTSAVYLATAAARRGVDVVLVGCGPQGSALEWAADAAADPLPLPVVPAPRPSLWTPTAS